MAREFFDLLMSDNAFYEKAGVSQEIFLLPSRRCRHPSIRSH